MFVGFFGGEPPCCKHLLPTHPVDGKAFSGPFICSWWLHNFLYREVELFILWRTQGLTKQCCTPSASPHRAGRPKLWWGGSKRGTSLFKMENTLHFMNTSCKVRHCQRLTKQTLIAALQLSQTDVLEGKCSSKAPACFNPRHSLVLAPGSWQLGKLSGVQILGKG